MVARFFSLTETSVRVFEWQKIKAAKVFSFLNFTPLAYERLPVCFREVDVVGHFTATACGV